MSDSTPIPAAAMIVLRDAPDGMEVMMVQRAPSLVFAGGALVFPGGRVDPGDRAIAARIDGTDETAHRIAAIREMIEETGLAIAATAKLADRRTELLAGEAPDALLPPDAFHLAELVPFAHWVPRELPHRLFDTRFYLARLPDDGGEPVADGGENVRAFWAQPGAAVARAEQTGARIIFPTRRLLERLATYRDVAAAFADARARPSRPITPWIEDREGVPHLCIPDDLGYPVTAEPMTSVDRA